MERGTSNDQRIEDRDGDAYVGDFRTNGYTADTLFNYLILLGWSPGDTEKVSREDAIKQASLMLTPWLSPTRASGLQGGMALVGTF